MAKAKRAAAKQGQRGAAAGGIVDDDDADDEREVITGQPAEDPDDEAESDVFAELRGLGADDEHRFTVHRVSSGKPGEQQGYCATYNAGDLSLDNIRDQFGGGKYRIRVTDSAGHYVTSRTVGIVSLPKPPAAPATPVAQSPDIAAIIAALKPQGGGDMQALILAMMNSQTEMIKAMVSSKPAGESLKITDILTLIQAANKGGGTSDAVATLLQGVKLGQQFGGGEAGALDVAREGLSILGGLIQEDRAKKAAAPAPVPAQQQRALPRAPAAPQPEAPAGAQQQEEPEMMQKLRWLRAQLKSLIYQAQRGKDPELYAEVMLDNLPPYFTVDEIMDRLEQPNAVQQLAMLDGAVNQHAEWFEKFRLACIELMTDDEEGDEPAPPGPGPGAGPVTIEHNGGDDA